MSKNKSGDLRGFYIVLGLVCAIAGGAVGWNFLKGNLDSAATEPVLEILTGELKDEDVRKLANVGVGKGEPSAPITIIEFADYQCPACQQFAKVIMPQVTMAYINNGLAKLVFHDFPLPGHPYAFLAARAARCAKEQGDQFYWPFHDQLFAHQPIWSASQSFPLKAYETYATNIGLNGDDFSACLNSDRHADVVTKNMRLGRELGVVGTPTIFVTAGGGTATRVNNWNEFAGIQEAIEGLISESESN